jgi:hypothetical protein
MGSKGPSPYPDKKPSQPEIRPPKGVDGPGGPPGSPPKKKCWEFDLVSPTEVAAKAKKGMTVDGIPRESRILIHADIGVLGFAPSTISAKIIAAQAATGGMLVGEVTAASSGKISIHLCLS